MTTIDDVDFMTEHSEKDSAVFLIDSGSRNRMYYPEPSEYVVDFSEPLRNVFGLDILDASVPGTMYNVDFHNCRLRYYLVSTSLPQDSWAQLGAEYPAAFEIMACSPTFVVSMAATSSSYDCYMMPVAAWRTMGGQLPITNSPTEFIVISYDIEQAMLTTLSDAFVQSLGLDEARTDVVERGDSVWFKSRGIWYRVDTEGAKARVRASASGDGTSCMCVLSDMRLGGASDIVFTNTYYIDMAGGDAHDSNAALLAEQGLHEWRVAMRTCELEAGNYNISSLGSALMDSMGREGFRVIPSTNSNFEKQNRYVFTNTHGPFVLDMKHSTTREMFGFDTLPVATVPLPDNDLLFFSTHDEKTASFRIKAPGIVNLLGVRYLTLRCPEVEDHIHGSRAYGKHSTGVGVFKLPAPNEIANLRFDFVNLIRKPFHPIGKVSRLTFRFEFNNGLLYDFKGINHHILITMKFYSPPRVPRVPRSLLNPDYDPNYLEYLQRVADYAERDEAASRRPSAAAAERHRMRRLLQLEQEFDHSTTDEDDDDDDGRGGPARAAGNRGYTGSDSD